MKKLQKMKNEKVARGRIVDPRGLVENFYPQIFLEESAKAK